MQALLLSQALTAHLILSVRPYYISVTVCTKSRSTRIVQPAHVLSHGLVQSASERRAKTDSNVSFSSRTPTLHLLAPPPRLCLLNELFLDRANAIADSRGDVVKPSSPSPSSLGLTAAPSSPGTPATAIAPTASPVATATADTASTAPTGDDRRDKNQNASDRGASRSQPLLSPEVWAAIDSGRYRSGGNGGDDLPRAKRQPAIVPSPDADGSSPGASTPTSVTASPLYSSPPDEHQPATAARSAPDAEDGKVASTPPCFQLDDDEMTSAGRLVEGDFLRAQVEGLVLRCVNADPNYGSMWFHCRHRPSDTAK